MRSVLMVALAVSACAPARAAAPPAPGLTYITVGTDAVRTVLAVEAAHGEVAPILAASGDVALMAVDPRELDDISQAMHTAHHRCGGYMVHESLADARAALVPAPEGAAIEYSLDRAALVTATLPKLSAAAIHRTIGELSAMKNRYYRSESGAAASAWLRDRWRSFSDRSDITIELFDQGYPQKSVIMTIPGTTKADEVVVIGGHLDSIALGGMASDAPGADDDASGIATLTEVARVLLQSDLRSERTIKFIAYAAEEVGLRGSLAVVKEFKRRGIHVVGALQLDMTNYQGSDRDIWLIDDHTSKPQNAFLVQLLEHYVGATWGSDRCGYACSDHASWTQAGIPASMPFEARFRDANTQIHSKRDTLERSQNNANHAVKFARLATAYAIELAKSEVAPPASAALATADGRSYCDVQPRMCQAARGHRQRHHRCHHGSGVAGSLAVLFLLLGAAISRRATAA